MIRLKDARAQVAELATSPVLRNAASLYGSTIITSALGFVFWLVVARLLSPSDVGTGSAVLSAATLVAAVFVLGLGTLTIADLAASKEGARRTISTAAVIASAAGLIGAFAFALLFDRPSTGIGAGLAGPLQLVAFVALAATTGATLVLDDASIGLLRGEIQLGRNFIFAASKLALLPALVSLARLHNGGELVDSWLIGTVLSLGLAFRLLARATDGSWKPDFRELYAKRRLVGGHHLLNISIIAPWLISPIVVTDLVGATANAGFTAALLVVGFVNVIPSHLSTALFALAPGDDERLTAECRSGVRICVLVAAASAIVFGIFSSDILRIFRGSYTSAAPAMAILGLSTLPSAIKAFYVAIARVQGKMTQAAVRSTLAAVGEVLGTVVGAKVDGVTGVAVGLLLAYVAEAMLLGPPVLAVLRGPVGRHRLVPG